MKIFKLSIVAALAAFLLASCTQDSLVPVSDNGVAQSKMVMRPFTMKGTKAPILGTTFPTTRDVMLAGYFYNNVAGQEYNVFYEPFTYSAQDEGWIPENDIFWPVKGKYALLGYSIEDDQNITDGDFLDEIEFYDGMWVEYSGIADQDDLLVGYAPATNAHNNTVVFKHALALAKFKAKSNTAYDAQKNIGITVDYIRFIDTPYSGVCTFGPENQVLNGVLTAAWSGFDNTDSYYAFDPAEPEDHIDLGSASYSVVGDNVLLIPTGFSFEVGYTAHAGLDANGDPIDLYESDIYYSEFDMQPGKKYTFNLDFVMNRMVVNCVLEDFDAVDDIDIEVPIRTAVNFVDLGLVYHCGRPSFDGPIARFSNLDLTSEVLGEMGTAFSYTDLLGMDLTEAQPGTASPVNYTWNLSGVPNADRWDSEEWCMPSKGVFGRLLSLEDITIDNSGNIVVTGTNGKQLMLAGLFLGHDDSIEGHHYVYYTLPYWSTDMYYDAVEGEIDSYYSDVNNSGWLTPSNLSEFGDYNMALLLDYLPILVFDVYSGDTEFVCVTDRLNMCYDYDTEYSLGIFDLVHNPVLNVDYPFLLLPMTIENLRNNMELLIRPVKDDDSLHIVEMTA